MASSQTNEAKSSCSSCCNDVTLDDVQPTYSDWTLQSDTVQISETNANPSEIAAVVKFDDDVAGQAVDIPEAIEAVNLNVSNNAELEKFLARPVNIYTYTWSVGGGTNFTIAPWYLFLNHTSIKKKIDNYYLFRGNLHLKFVVNASPFYYGCCMVAYNPLTAYNNPVINDTVGEPDINYSQLPRVYIYPSASQGAKMVLPFFYHKDWLDITTATEVQAMGELKFRFLDSLANANGATTDINIQVYAWLSDVKLSGPTVRLALQSGVEDEYGKGPISKPASAIAKALGYLENVPVIGKFATAGSMISSTVGKVASLFGFTNMPVIADIHAVVPAPHPQFATTDIGVPIEKMTLDSKNELSIDKKLLGLDLNDELLITSLTQRESYLTSFVWTTAGTSDALLWNTRINPSFAKYTPSVSQTVINMTPMALVNRAFAYWRGDIEVRFKIICSQYHRGRLRFNWDPRGDVGATSDSTTETYTKIVDIAESTDIIIRVPYINELGYLNTDRGFTSELFGTTAKTRLAGYDNGVLTVRILNELTAPIDSADITILVFVRAADNIEFGVPCAPGADGRLSPYTVQSGILSYDDDNTMEESIALYPSVSPPENNLIYLGETIKSIRTLLRRTVFSRTASYIRSTAANQLVIMQSYFSRFPLYPGFDPNGINNANAPISLTVKPYNYVSYTYLNWFGQCFLGHRGAINWKVNHLNPFAITETRLGRPPIALQVLTKLGYNAIAASDNSTITVQRSGPLNCTSSFGGVNVTNQRTLSSNAASFPLYSNYKFLSPSPETMTLGDSVDASEYDGVIYSMSLAAATLNTSNSQFFSGNYVNYYVAAGTDFDFVFFMAVPTLYYYDAYPTAANDST